MNVDEREWNRKVNKRLAITYFSILILIQLIVFIYIYFNGFNTFSLILALLSTVVAPIALGYALIHLFKKIYSRD